MCIRDRSLQIERSASTPMEGKGVYARWDSDEQSIRLYSSTQTSTGVRAAVAAKLGMPLAKVECLSLIHISEPTRLGMISYAVFCLKKKKAKCYDLDASHGQIRYELGNERRQETV